MKKIDATHVGVLYTCNGVATTDLPDCTKQFYYVFTCADELALISEFARVNTRKHNTLMMPVDYTQPLLNEGDTASITFAQQYKQHHHKAPTVWWQPVGYASYVPRTGNGSSVTP